MREFFREILHALEAGRPVELVSVVRASGSTPRGAGAMMAVFPDGSIAVPDDPFAAAAMAESAPARPVPKGGFIPGRKA